MTIAMPEYMTVAEAAAHLNVSEKVIYGLTRKPFCPFAIHVSAKTIRISKDLLDEWVRDGGLEKMEKPPHLLTIAEVAEKLKVSQQTIGRIVESGAMPHTKFGRSILLDPADVNAWLSTKHAAAAGTNGSNGSSSTTEPADEVEAPVLDFRPQGQSAGFSSLPGEGRPLL